MKKIVSILVLLLVATLVMQAADTRAVDMNHWRASYIAYGERYLGKPWPQLPASEFARYKKDGNRVGYETVCFERRKHLAALVMAEIQERKGRFMPDIVKGLNAVIAEPWWGIPAHYDRSQPVYSVQTVDLFNAETASLMAWTAKELRGELDKFAPGLYAKLANEIKHRMLRPALGSKYGWKSSSSNWNPWICSNWLACVMLCEDDATLRQQAVTEIEGCIRAFIDKYPEDGGCEEGFGYWDRAAASLFDCLDYLGEIEKKGLAEVTMLNYRSDKVHRMGAYIYNIYIGSNQAVNFADSHAGDGVAQMNILFPFAVYLNDKAMMGFAAWIAKEKNYFGNPASFYEWSGNFPTLGRELRMQRYIDRLAQTEPIEPKSEAWYADLQIKTMRTADKFVAFKGGHNDENHNHNDVGSFIVYDGNKPLLIDPGVGEYTAKTFSSERYTIWTMQSAYHNLPQINGMDQKYGKSYHSDVVKQSRHSLTLDIAPAYPAEAAAKRWLRTVKVKGNVVNVKEKYELTEWRSPVRLMYMTSVKPDVSQQGVVRLGTHTISYPKNVTVSVEDVMPLCDAIMRDTWGGSLYRLVFTVNDGKTKDKLAFSIR